MKAKYFWLPVLLSGIQLVHVLKSNLRLFELEFRNRKYPQEWARFCWWKQKAHDKRHSTWWREKYRKSLKRNSFQEVVAEHSCFSTLMAALHSFPHTGQEGPQQLSEWCEPSEVAEEPRAQTLRLQPGEHPAPHNSPRGPHFHAALQ